MLRLKKILADIAQTQKTLADHCGVSTAAIAQVINYNQWPKDAIKKEYLRENIKDFLFAHNVNVLIQNPFLEVEPECATTQVPDYLSNQSQEDRTMLLRKNRLSQDARQYFKLPRDPFTDEMREDKDVFLSDNIRYVRAQVRQTAEHGGMLAVSGESGAGKSTIRQDLESWINAFGKPITIISPFSELGMEGDKPTGKPLKAQNIIESIIQTINPLEKPRRSSEARARQMHKMLCDSAHAGYKHTLIIEEAHRLSIPTIKHLKQFYELQDGFTKLISVIMIGQTELESRLSEFNPEVREVVQRCELVRLHALDEDLEGYIKHKFERIGMDYKNIIDGFAIDEIRNRLRTSDTVGRGAARTVKTMSLCYPLAVNNLLSGAMNIAVSVHSPKVTAELVTAAIQRD